MNVLEKLIFYWNYPFVRYALIVGVLIALCSSLLGVTLVLKRFSFIGDGLSHVAFGGMAIATVLGMSDHMPLTLAVTVACAVLLLHAHFSLSDTRQGCTLGHRIFLLRLPVLPTFPAWSAAGSAPIPRLLRSFP